MDRIRRGSFGFRPALFLLLASALLASSGCKDLITTTYLMMRGFQTPADYPGLKEKTVAVVCRSARSINPDQESAVRLIPARVGDLLTMNGKKITVIDPLKVERWIDENGVDSFTDVGEALDVDMVVGIELDEYSLYLSSSVLQGNATIRTKVYDIKGGKKLVYDTKSQQIKFPPSAGTSTSEIPRPEFNNMFIEVICNRIGINFYDHDHTADFANDSTVLR